MIDEIVDSVDEHRFRAEISVSAQLQHLNIVRFAIRARSTADRTT
jgi:hypothetical protein